MNNKTVYVVLTKRTQTPAIQEWLYLHERMQYNLHVYMSQSANALPQSILIKYITTTAPLYYTKSVNHTLTHHHHKQNTPPNNSFITQAHCTPPRSADHASAAPTASSSTSAGAAATWALAVLRAELGSTIGLWLTGAVAVGSTVGVAGASCVAGVDDAGVEGVSATGPAAAGL